MPVKTRKTLTPKQKNLVRELSVNVREGRVEPMKSTLIRAGYSLQMAKKPIVVLNGKGIQRELKPIVQQLEALRQKAIDAINNKNLNKERLDSVVNLMRQATHDSQLLSGGATGSITLTIDNSLAQKYSIQASQ